MKKFKYKSCLDSNGITNLLLLLGPKQKLSTKRASKWPSGLTSMVFYVISYPANLINNRDTLLRPGMGCRYRLKFKQRSLSHQFQDQIVFRISMVWIMVLGQNSMFAGTLTTSGGFTLLGVGVISPTIIFFYIDIYNNIYFLSP